MSLRLQRTQRSLCGRYSASLVSFFAIPSHLSLVAHALVICVLFFVCLRDLAVCLALVPLGSFFMSYDLYVLHLIVSLVISLL